MSSSPILVVPQPICVEAATRRKQCPAIKAVAVSYQPTTSELVLEKPDRMGVCDADNGRAGFERSCPSQWALRLASPNRPATCTQKLHDPAAEFKPRPGAGLAVSVDTSLRSKASFLMRVFDKMPRCERQRQVMVRVKSQHSPHERLSLNSQMSVC